jgi:DNA repair protein RadA/Sms
VIEAARGVTPDAMIIDSIQTLSRGDLEGGPGTVSQVRECALALLHYAKDSNAAVFLVGHVTKDGAVAGPRVLEHMVDAVLYLEGERYQHYRVLRAAKNRFGSTTSRCVRDGRRGSPRSRTESGVSLVRSLAAGAAGRRGGRGLEGRDRCSSRFAPSRPAFGTPQRVTNGFSRRLAVLLAVLERRGLPRRHDVFRP